MNYTKEQQERKYTDDQLEVLLFRAKYELSRRKEMMFIGYLLMSLKVHITTRIPTAGVDADMNLYINPYLIESLSQAEVSGVLAHEVLHLALEHFGRKGDRDHKIFNLAGDVIINRYLNGLGVDELKLPEWVYDNDKVPHDSTTEEAYDIIKDEHDKRKENGESQEDIDMSIEDFLDVLESGQFKAGGDDDGDGDGQRIRVNTQDATPEQLQRIRNAIISAEQNAKKTDAYGSVPEFVRRQIEQIRNPLVDWKIVLRRYLNAINQKAFSWARPNRRHLARGGYMPSRRGKELERIVIAIDTSGSIGTKELEQFAGDIQGIYKTYDPEVIRVIQFNTEIMADINIRGIKDVQQMKYEGCGGTDVTSTLKAYEADNAKCLVVITDGYFNINKNMNPNGKDVIWLIYDNRECQMPFGRVVHIQI